MPESTRNVLGSAVAKGLVGQPIEVIARFAPQFERLVGDDGCWALGSNLVSLTAQDSPANWKMLISELIPNLESLPAKAATIQSGLNAAVNFIELAELLHKDGIPEKVLLESLEKELSKRVAGNPEFVGN